MGDEDWAALASAQEQKLLNRQLEEMKLKGVHGGGDSVIGTATITTGSGGRGRGRGMHSNVTAPTVGAMAAASNSSQGSVKDSGDGQSSAGSVDDDTGVSRADASLMNKLIRSQLVNTTSDIEVLRKDPNSPLYHIKNFNELRLKPELLRGVYDMGFNAPSKIQETALPALLADPPMNMIAQSQSGTGKTAAFVLTMLSRVDPMKAYPQCLCLAPTYELALQIGDVTKKMAKFMPNIGICYAIRGETVGRNVAIQEQIVIGTPGTVFDWCTRFKCVDLKKIDVFVLDEADVMIDKQGHADQSVRIHRGLRKDCQLLFFSATYDDEIMTFAKAIVSDPMIIRLKRSEESLDTIRQYYIECSSLDAKFEALSNIYGSITIAQSMIFCHTRKTASWLTEKMMEQGNPVALLTGELDVRQRADIINRFRSGKEKVLITTNVSARGIDVDQVTVVVNFDLPVDATGQVDCETYLHRIGRTGRFGKRGIAINMIDGTRSRNMMQAIEKHFGRTIKRLDALNPDEIEKITQP